MSANRRYLPFNFLWLLVAAVVCAGPVILLAAETLESVIQHPDWLLLIWPGERRTRLLINSLSLSGCTAVACMIIGLLAGLAIWRMNPKISVWLKWAVLIFIPLPPYIHALAWMAAIQSLNTVLSSLGIPPISLQGWWGTFWVQCMALLPLAVGIALLSLQTVDPELIEAGQLLAPGYAVLTKVILPLSRPLLASGAGFLFLLTLIDHSVSGLFGLNTYALDLFAEFSATNQPARAFLLAFPGLLVGFLILTIIQTGIRRVTQPIVFSQRSVAHFSLPVWMQILEQTAIGLVTLQIIIPLVTLIGTAGSITRFGQSVWAARDEIGFTFWISLAATTISLIVGWMAAKGLNRYKRHCAALWWIITTPLAVPAPLIGIALIMFLNRPIWGELYGSAAMPVLAAAGRFLPYATLLIAVQLNRIDPLFFEAAQIASGNPIRRLVKIQLPLLAPGFLAAAMLVFSLTLSELGATLLVVPPGQSTLTLRIYNYLHYGASAEVAGLCLMLTITLVFSFILIILCFSVWKRLQDVKI